MEASLVHQLSGKPSMPRCDRTKSNTVSLLLSRLTFSVATNALLHSSPGMIEVEIRKTSDLQFQ